MRPEIAPGWTLLVSPTGTVSETHLSAGQRDNAVAAGYIGLGWDAVSAAMIAERENGSRVTEPGIAASLAKRYWEEGGFPPPRFLCREQTVFTAAAADALRVLLVTRNWEGHAIIVAPDVPATGKDLVTHLTNFQLGRAYRTAEEEIHSLREHVIPKRVLDMERTRWILATLAHPGFAGADLDGLAGVKTEAEQIEREVRRAIEQWKAKAASRDQAATQALDQAGRMDGFAQRLTELATSAERLVVGATEPFRSPKPDFPKGPFTGPEQELYALKEYATLFLRIPGERLKTTLDAHPLMQDGRLRKALTLVSHVQHSARRIAQATDKVRTAVATPELQAGDIESAVLYWISHEAYRGFYNAPGWFGDALRALPRQSSTAKPRSVDSDEDQTSAPTP